MENVISPIVLSFTVTLFLGWFIYSIVKIRGTNRFKKSRALYVFTLFLCVITLITTYMSMVFYSLPQITKDNIMIETTLGDILGIFIYLLFYAPAIGFVIAGIKSIKEKKSPPIRISPTFSSFTYGLSAQVHAIGYILIGVVLLLSLLLFGIQVFLNY